MQATHLLHHRFVDRQATGCIHDQDVVIVLARVIQSAERDVFGLLRCNRCKRIDTDLACQSCQLLYCRRAIDIATYQQYLLFLVRKQLRQFAGGRRFSGPLQARHQDNSRRNCRKIERIIATAHQFGEFVVYDTHQCLSWCEAANYLLTDRLVLDPGDEIFHHRQRDIGLQQRDADLSQCVLDIGLRQA